MPNSILSLVKIDLTINDVVKSVFITDLIIQNKHLF